MVGASVAFGGRDQPAPVSTGSIDGVPTIGVDLHGWRLEDEDGDVDPPFDWDIATATFRPEGSPSVEPYVWVGVTPGGPTVDVFPDGEPVDLGTGVTAYLSDHDGPEVIWFEPDGDYPWVNAAGVPAEQVVEYARRLAADDLDPLTAPAPPGFPVATRGTMWDSGAVMTRSRYVRGDASLVLEVTNQPGWLEAGVDDAKVFYDLNQQIDIGANPLGEGTALFGRLREGTAMTIPEEEPPSEQAYWLTQDGLSVRVFAEGPGSPGVVRQVLEGGLLVIL